MAPLTTKAEYMVVVEAAKEIIWMRDFISELVMLREHFRLLCDNQGAIHVVKNVAYHSRTKHIERRYNWIRDRVEERKFVVVKIHTDDNESDMLTKVLPMDKLNAC